MSKTSLEVTTEALRMIGVLAVDEDASAADHARAKAHLEAIYAELDDTQALALEWTIETVPDKLFLAAAQAVGGSIASAYGRPDFMTLKEIGMEKIRKDEWANKPRATTQMSYF